MAAKSQAIVDRVHDEAIGSLPAAQRTVLIAALTALAQDHLAVPADTAAGIRRVRQQ